MSENIKLLKCHFLVKSIHARRLVFYQWVFAPVMNGVNSTWVMINSQQYFIDFPYHYKIIYDAYLVSTHCTTLHFMNFDIANHTWGCCLQLHCSSSIIWFNSWNEWYTYLSVWLSIVHVKSLLFCILFLLSKISLTFSLSFSSITTHTSICWDLVV